MSKVSGAKLFPYFKIDLKTNRTSTFVCLNNLIKCCWCRLKLTPKSHSHTPSVTFATIEDDRTHFSNAYYSFQAMAARKNNNLRRWLYVKELLGPVHTERLQPQTLSVNSTLVNLWNQICDVADVEADADPDAQCERALTGQHAPQKSMSLQAWVTIRHLKLSCRKCTIKNF